MDVQGNCQNLPKLMTLALDFCYFGIGGHIGCFDRTDATTVCDDHF